MSQNHDINKQFTSTDSGVPLNREDVQFRFRSHVQEYICPASPERKALGRHSVFAGGGITNCPDWQVAFAELVNDQLAALSSLDGSPDEECQLSILNPRRTNFPIHDPTASQFQIAWEHTFLEQVKAVSLWFPNGSEGPISLFETGKWMMSAKPFFLGIEPGYARKEELLAHIQAVRPNLQAAESLEEHATNVAKWALGTGQVDFPEMSRQVRDRSIYLAGGIKGCPDWQQEAMTLLSGMNLEVENPRIDSFVRGDNAEYRSLVRKNRLTLDSCESVVVWFPKDQLTPVALLELGSLVASAKPLFVGIEPGYKRQIDVEIQTELARPEIDIAYSLPELTDQVRRYYAMRSRP